jgi:hypothetical protein
MERSEVDLSDPEPRFNVHLARKFLKKSMLPEVLHRKVLAYIQTTSSYVDALLRLNRRFSVVTPSSECKYAMCFRSSSLENIGCMGKLKIDSRGDYYIRLKRGGRVYGLFINAAKYTRLQRTVVAKAFRDVTWRNQSFGYKTLVGIDNDGSFVERHSFGSLDRNCVAAFIAGQSLKKCTFNQALDMCLYSCVAEAPLISFMVGVLHGSRWKHLPLVLICRKRVMFHMFKIVKKLDKTILACRFDDYVRRGIDAKFVSYNQIHSIML